MQEELTDGKQLKLLQHNSGDKLEMSVLEWMAFLLA